MKSNKLVKKWFEVWSRGDTDNLPISADFRHTSPYGVIEGRSNYLKIVSANSDKFLNNRFEIRDSVFKKKRACIRYKVSQADFSMEVSEWYYFGKNNISEIVAYCNIPGEIPQERALSKAT